MFKRSTQSGRLGRAKFYQPLFFKAIAVYFWIFLGVALAETQDKHPAPVFQENAMQVKSTLFLETTRKLDFEAARLAKYEPFNSLEKLSLEGKVAWLRIILTDEAKSRAPIYIRLLPPILEDVVLFSPDADVPGAWKSQSLVSAALNGSISVLDELPSGPIYLKITARADSVLFVVFGSQEEIRRFNQKLDMLTMGISTILVIFWLQIIWRTIFYFKPLYLALCFLLPSIAGKFLITFGYVQSLFQIDITPEPYGPHTIVTNIIASIVFILLIRELFPAKRWLNVLWVFVGIAIINLVFYFFYPVLVKEIDNYLRVFGSTALFLCCIWAAKDVKNVFRSVNEKMALISWRIQARSATMTNREKEAEDV